MKDVPAIVWGCLTVVFLGIIAAFVILSVTGSSTADLRSFLNIMLNIGSVILGGGGFAFGASAAINSKKAAEQTNGALKPVVKSAVKEALDENGGDGNGRPTV